MLNQDSLIDDDAIEFTCPADPMYANPCVRDGRYRDELNVDDAVENRPLVNPIVVDVELYPVLTVNGKANVGRPSDDVAVSVYPPLELPSSICPYDGAVVNPVPPYITPIDDVAETTPAFACSGPFSVVPRVSVPICANVDDDVRNDE